MWFTYHCIGSIENLTQEVKGTNQRLDIAYDQQERHYREQTARALTDRQRKCHQLFKISNYEQHKDINPGRVPGTCQWVLQNPQYHRWWNSCCNDLLWISADPGCGKSVLAKSLIDDDFKALSPSVSICYFFFKDNDEQNNLATALCAILHQLFSQQPNLLRHALPSCDRNGSKLQREAGELWRIFIAATSHCTSANTLCVLDALDECHPGDQKQLIQRLEGFYHRTESSTVKTWLKFLITSRPYDEVEHRFKAIKDFFPYIHLKGEEENYQIREEVNLVVKVRVKELAETAVLSSDVQQRLEHQLLQMEHRTYLWLYLAIDDIRTTFKDSLWPAEESIRLIPPSVDAAYGKILARVPSNQVNTVRKILQIIVGARRPLTIQEMAMALGIALFPESRSAAKAGISPVRLATKIRQLCGLFVFINNSKIYLIHQTAREFLISRDFTSNPNSIYAFNLTDAESIIAQVCVRYLLMEDLEENKQETEIDHRSLLEYSAVHWPDHIRSLSHISLAQQQEIDELLDQLYNRHSARWILWSRLFWRAAMGSEWMPKMDAIHLAAFNGHTRMVQKLLTGNENDTNKADNTGSNALIWASLNGHTGVTELLLQQGADVSAQGGKHGSALYAASVKGYDKVVNMLLQHGADVNAQGEYHASALYAASLEGHDTTVQVLLQYGADANTQGGVPGNALQVAFSKGHYNIVQMLLHHGAYNDAQGGYYGSALYAASFRGHHRIVQLLLQHGADVNAEGGLYGNALQAASFKGHDMIVQLLLQYGANANSQGGEYGNALLAASLEGHDTTVHVLLQHGAEVDAQDGLYGSALYTASFQGHDKIVQTLLQQGADVSAPGGADGNALYTASFKGHDKIVQLLLQYGANANSQGGEYGNPLLAASLEGHDTTVQVLLQHGANANAQCGEHGSGLYAASFEGHHKIVQMLLQHGADVNAEGGLYGNALQAASLKKDGKVVQMLLQHGADVNAEGGLYGNALHAASFKGRDTIVQMLLQHGADVNAQGGLYGNALQAASLKRRDKVVQMLLQHGADVNAQGGVHGNALQAASSGGNDKIILMLFQCGANVNAQGGYYGNALYAASVKEHDTTVQVLLQHGADVNIQDGYHASALYAASLEGHEKVVQMLLQHGADVNAQGGLYGNALHAASFKGRDTIVQMLLQHGADVNAQGGLYGNASQAASFKGHDKIVQLLLQHGADVNARGGVISPALLAPSLEPRIPADSLPTMSRENDTKTSRRGETRPQTGDAASYWLAEHSPQTSCSSLSDMT
jgi:ankyrin repeat protein